MDGHDGWRVRHERRRIGGRKEHVEMVPRGGSWQLRLLPPRAGRARDDARGEAPGIERQARWFRRIEHELVTASLVGARPFVEQAAQIPPNARGAARQLARVDADAHQFMPCRRARCSMASWYASRTCSAIEDKWKRRARSMPAEAQAAASAASSNR